MSLKFLSLALTVGVALAAEEVPAAPDPGPLFEACGRDFYYHGKQGFPTVERARDHAFKEFKREVAAGRVDPSDREYFTYIFRLRRVKGGPRLFLHTPWVPAEDLGRRGGQHFFQASCPLQPKEDLRIYTMIHSHPTRGVGSGPSWADLATASRYRNKDGSYRHLYLINNLGKLVTFRARHPLEAGRASARPGQPRRHLDWMD